MDNLKGWQNAIRSNFTTAEEPSPVLAALRAGYLFALQTPHNVVRIRNQQTLCLLRDSIAELEGRDPEEVQNEFEELALLARQELNREP